MMSWDAETDLSFPDSPGSWNTGTLNTTNLSGSAVGLFTITLSDDFDDNGIDSNIATVSITVDYTPATPPPSIASYLNGAHPTSDPSNGGTQPPATLSSTDAFTDLTSLTPIPGLIPYEVNSPLWSDGAHKQRWIAIPSDGVRDSASEQIVFDAEAPWTFPAGTVAIKHFELPTNANSPSQIRRLETRFLVATGNGDFYGLTYRWRADGSDADLLTNGASDDIQVTEICSISTRCAGDLNPPPTKEA